MAIKVYTISDDDAAYIANLCEREQGTSEAGIKAEASLIVNKWDLCSVKSSKYNNNIKTYCETCGWWGPANKGKVTPENATSKQKTWVIDVISNGKRTLPTCVDEHDYIGNITYVSNNGVSFSKHNRSSYEQNVTKIKNQMGATYTFWCFPTSTSDPFGYTKSSKDKCGGIILPDGTISSDGTSGGMSDLYEGGYLFDRDRYKDDAIIREVSYWNNSKSEPTLSSNNIRCAVINYTDELSAFLVSALGYSGSNSVNSNTSVDTSKVSKSNARSIIESLIAKGLNAAAACGITGNIYYESRYNPAAIGDNGTSFGLCQWHNERGTAMKNYVGSNWKNNITGQLDYLWSELSGSYKSSVLNPLQSVANTSDGAKSAADTFVRKFEIPANVDSASTKRQAKAAELFGELVIQV